MARRSLEQIQYLRRLHPAYDDCPRICQRTNQYQSEFCGGCTVKDIQEGFERDCKDDFKLVEGNEAFSFEKIEKDYYAATRSAAQRETGHEPHWTLRLSRCVDIIRSERNRVDRIRDYEDERRRNKNKG